MTFKEWIYNRNETGEKSLIKRLLASRGITGEKDIEEFLNPLSVTPSDPNVFYGYGKVYCQTGKGN